MLDQSNQNKRINENREKEHINTNADGANTFVIGESICIISNRGYQYGYEQYPERKVVFLAVGIKPVLVLNQLFCMTP